jgi:hypothetical protein
MVKLNELLVCIFTYLFSLMSQIIYLMTRDVILFKTSVGDKMFSFPLTFPLDE